MTAAAAAWKPTVETTGSAAAVTVRDALVAAIADAAGSGTDFADAAVSGTLPEASEVVPPLDGDPASADLCRGVAVELLELLLPADGLDFVDGADDDAVVDAGVDGPEAAAVLAVVVGSVPLDPVPVTEASTPLEACTSLARRSVEGPD
jgi:hypothetical protein